MAAGLAPQFHLIGGNPQEIIADFTCGRDRAAVDLANVRFAERACNSHADLVAALEEAANCLIWAAQESTGRVKKEIVGGWVHHSNKARAALAAAKGEA